MSILQLDIFIFMTDVLSNCMPAEAGKQA